MPEYNEYVQKFLDEQKRRSDSAEGFTKKPVYCNPLFLKRYQDYVDPWNPMYSQPGYSQEKLGAALALPQFVAGAFKSVLLPPLDSAAGVVIQTRSGIDYDFFKPVFAGEFYHAFNRAAVFCETDSQRPGELAFTYLDADADIYDAADNKVMSFRRVSEVRIRPDYETAISDYKKHWYTEEEKAWFRDIMANEKLRGADTLYWEDVTTGEALPPATYGPLAPLDMIFYSGACHNLTSYPLRRLRELSPELVGHNDDNNAYRVFNSYNYTDDAMAGKITGVPVAFQIPEFAVDSLMRLVTNWAGDEGFVTKFNWRHLGPMQLYDCAVAYGSVTGKLTAENGEHIVQLDVWLENVCRGNVTDRAQVWVRLPART